MTYTMAQVAQALGAEVLGDSSIEIARASSPDQAGPGDLALAMSPKYGAALAVSRADAALIWPGADWQALGMKAAIEVQRPRLAMAHLTQATDPGPRIAPGIHPSAVVDPTAQIEAGAAIGPFVQIGAGVKIGTKARIASHVSIAEGTRIGDQALILQGVRIGSNVQIGDRFICQPGAVLGGDGFSFVTEKESAVERARRTLGDRGEIEHQEWQRIHSLGSVSIGDDVEIGANSCIDKGTVVNTSIGHRTKIDNLVHIGHNNQIGEDCLICGQVGMAGSSKVGNRVVLGGQCGVNDNITIGDDVVAGGASKIFTRVKPGALILGYPAQDFKGHLSSYKALRRLPRLARDVAALKKALLNPDATD